MKLKTEALVKAGKEWRGWLFGILMIMVITPCASFAVLAIPSDSPALTHLLFGLAIFFIMPTTLSSGVVLTKEANGNFALALLLTTITNLLSIAVIPFMVQLIFLFQDYVQTEVHMINLTSPNATGNGTGGNTTEVEVQIDAVQILVKLALAILLPLVVGKVMLYVSHTHPHCRGV